MGTEKFMAFKEDGTAYRLKGRILRFLDAEPVSSADKSNMRSSLGITSQGGLGDLLAANNLDDVASKDTAKLNLEVPIVGTAANEVPVNGMLNSGAWLDFDAFYEEGTWTPSVSFGGGSTGVLYDLQEGSYTRVGDTVYVTAVMTLADKGSSNGNAKLEGLPFAARDTTISGQALIFSYAISMTGLTSALTGLILNNSNAAAIYNWSSTGASSTTDTNFSDTTSLRFSATYQIA